MTTLRVLVADAPSSGQELAWALFDADGRCSRTGRAVPSRLPGADRVEAVVDAGKVRIAVVDLPPVAPARVPDAARYALEDQFAVPGDALHLATSARRPDGRVRVIIVDRGLLNAIGSPSGPLPRPTRILAESDLANAGPGWHWCASAGDAGFVRCADGSAFPVDAPAPNGALPSGLALALAQASRNGSLPSEIVVDAPFADASLAQWQRDTGVAFRNGTPWRWHAAPAAAFADALDLSATRAAGSPAKPGQRSPTFAFALGIAGAAFALHVLATMADWAWLRFESHRMAQTLATLAADAGVPPEAASDPVSARAAIAKRYAEIRHAHGLLAPDDALPLLARAAPALAALPPGTVRSLAYASGHWTLDLTRGDAVTLSDLDARLREAGVPALSAVGTTGARIRFGTR